MDPALEFLVVRLERTSFLLQRNTQTRQDLKFVGEAGAFGRHQLGCLLLGGGPNLIGVKCGLSNDDLRLVDLLPQSLSANLGLFGDARRRVAAGFGLGGDLGGQLIGFTAGVFHRQVDRVSRHRKESRRAVGRLRLASKRFDLRIESSDLKLELTLSHVAFVATEPRVHIVASIAVPITAPWSTSGRPKSSDYEESGLCLGQ